MAMARLHIDGCINLSYDQTVFATSARYCVCAGPVQISGQMLWGRHCWPFFLSAGHAKNGKQVKASGASLMSKSARLLLYRPKYVLSVPRKQPAASTFCIHIHTNEINSSNKGHIE